MFSRSRTVLVAASAAMLAGLSGCALLEPALDEKPLSDVAACTIGHTWNLDTADLAAALLTVLQHDHPDVSAVDAAGAKSIEWGVDNVLTVTSDLTITVTAGSAEEPLVIRQTQVGTAGGKAYINTDVAIPRNWRDDIEVTTTGEAAGAPVEALPFALPITAFDDTVGLELTCGDGTLTVHPRGNPVTQRWTNG